MADGPFDPETGELIPRDPSVEDLVSLCRELHAQGAKFMVVGGFSIRAAGYGRHTTDIDILIDAELENEARVYEALATLPDGCVRELEAGEVEKYTVVRDRPARRHRAGRGDAGRWPSKIWAHFRGGVLSFEMGCWGITVLFM
jgi:hypothetical protein